MSEARITVPGGPTITVAQLMRLKAHTDEFGPGNSHWHLNDCKCCLTIHGPDCAYVIDSDGGETFFASRGCGCEHDA